MLQFNADTARLLEDAYLGSDFSARRRASFDALSPQTGELILDIGCGNGMLLPDLSRAVGRTGQVIGIDPSDDMRAAAATRCEDMSNVSVISGGAAALPVAPASADKAVSIQVFEYLEDIPAILKEIARALRPGGRLVIGDIHFGTFTWRSDDPARMAAMLAAWDQHVTYRDIPARLPGWLKETGYIVESVRPLCTADHVLQSDGYARLMMLLMPRFAVDNGHMSENEATAWVDEQEELARQGRFFMSITHYVVAARRP